MQGYWNAPELTFRNFRNGCYPGERLLHSGDLFRRDEEGYVYFVGRMDEQIKMKGEKASPPKMENVVFCLSDVAEAALIGVPDEILGQAIKCFVVPQPGAQLTGNNVLKHCADRLETFMIPKYVEFIAELPKTPHGKIDRKALCQSEQSSGAPRHDGKRNLLRHVR